MGHFRLRPVRFSMERGDLPMTKFLSARFSHSQCGVNKLIDIQMYQTYNLNMRNPYTSD